VRIFSKSEPVSEIEIENAFVEAHLSDGTLHEYTINNIELHSTNVWFVDYSVLPKDGHTMEWIAGNGEFGEDGWIVHKSLFVHVVKTDGVVHLRIIGTGL